jgi:DNA-nicking Smr family endonuclease
MAGCVDPLHGQGYIKPMVKNVGIKDAGLFSAAMADVKPLEDRRRLTQTAPAKATPVVAKPPPMKQTAAVQAEPDLGADDKSFDRDVSRALSRGKLSPEATLDLHGMTLAVAERAVSRFLARVVERDHRVVLVVTGKGLREEGGRRVGGRIRAEFIGWLNRADNRGLVRSVRPAHPNHGGSGAFYLLLRRRKRPRL